jgi:hypothetical protein
VKKRAKKKAKNFKKRAKKLTLAGFEQGQKKSKKRPKISKKGQKS